MIKVQSTCTQLNEINTQDMVYQYDSETASIILEAGYKYDITTKEGDTLTYSLINLEDTNAI